jgi:hypothetical protein
MSKNYKKYYATIISSLFFSNLISTNSFASDNLNLKVGFSEFFATNKNESNNIQELNKNLIDKLSQNNKFLLIKLSDETKNLNLVVSDEIIEISKDKLIDFIITGTISKVNDNYVINLRIFETVTGKVVYNNQYIYKKNETETLINKIVSDIDAFRISLPTQDINIADLREGDALVRVSTLPSEANIILDGKYFGKTPVIFKNLSPYDHLIETYKEIESSINAVSITPEDGKSFQGKLDDKNFNFESSYIDELNTKELRLEIFPQDYESRRNRIFKLELETIPEDAEILVNNISYPKDKLFISEGIYSIKVLPKKLFPFIKQVDAYKKQISNVHVNLFKLGRVLISSNPQNAEIYVDGESSGFTPKSLDLPQGEHFIELKREGFSLESLQVNVLDDSIKEYNLNLSSLKNANTNASFLPTGLVDDVLSTSVHFLSLGQYSKNDLAGALSYFYGGELSYGFKNVYQFTKDISLSPQLGIFYNKLSSLDNTQIFTDNYGPSLKIQFLSQNNDIPVSLASGTTYNVSKNFSEAFNGFVAFSRDFGFLSADLGFQFNQKGFSALNLNFNYNKFYRFKISASTLINFNLLNNKQEEYLTPLFGLNIGYNLF